MYPLNLNNFLKVLGAANFAFITDVIQKAFDYDPIDQKAPFRFDNLDINNSFLKNGGSQMIILFSFILLVAIFYFLHKKFTKNKEVTV
jgi:hypothetical protein